MFFVSFFILIVILRSFPSECYLFKTSLFYQRKLQVFSTESNQPRSPSTDSPPQRWRFIPKNTTKSHSEQLQGPTPSPTPSPQGKVVFNAEGKKIYMRHSDSLDVKGTPENSFKNFRSTNTTRYKRNPAPLGSPKLQALLLVPLIIPKDDERAQNFRNSLLTHSQTIFTHNKHTTAAHEASSTSISSSPSISSSSSSHKFLKEDSKKTKPFSDGSSTMKRKKKNDFDSLFGSSSKKFSHKSDFDDDSLIDEGSLSSYQSSLGIDDAEIMSMHESGLTMEEMLEEIYERHAIVLPLSTIKRKLYLLYHSKKSSKKGKKSKSGSKSQVKSKSQISSNIYEKFSSFKNPTNLVIIPTPSSNNFFSINSLAGLLSTSPLRLLMRLRRFHAQNPSFANPPYTLSLHLNHVHLVQFLKFLDVSYIENEDFIFKKELQNEELLEEVDNPLDLPILERVLLPSFVAQEHFHRTNDQGLQINDADQEMLASISREKPLFGIIDLSDSNISGSGAPFTTPIIDLMGANTSSVFSYKPGDGTHAASFINLSPYLSSIYTNSSFLFPEILHSAKPKIYFILIDPTIKYESLAIPPFSIPMGEDKPTLIPILVKSRGDKDISSKLRSDLISSLSTDNMDNFNIDFSLPVLTKDQAGIQQCFQSLFSLCNIEAETVSNAHEAETITHAKSKASICSGRILEVNYFSSEISKNKQKKQFVSTLLLDSPPPTSAPFSICLKKNDWIVSGLNKGRVLGMFDYYTKKEITEAFPGDLVQIYGLDYINSPTPFLPLEDLSKENPQNISEHLRSSFVFHTSSSEDEIRDLYEDNVERFKEYTDQVQEKKRQKNLEDFLALTASSDGKVETSDISIPLLIRTNNSKWYSFLLNLFQKKLLVHVLKNGKRVSPFISSIGLGDLTQKDEQISTITPNSLLLSIDRPIIDPFQSKHDKKKDLKEKKDSLSLNKLHFDSLETFLADFFSETLSKLKLLTSSGSQTAQAIGRVKKLFKINNKVVVGLRIESGNLKFGTSNYETVRAEIFQQNKDSTFSVEDFSSLPIVLTQLQKAYTPISSSLLESLKIGANPTDEVKEGKDCGVSLVDNEIKPKEGDLIVFY